MKRKYMKYDSELKAGKVVLYKDKEYTTQKVATGNRRNELVELYQKARKVFCVNGLPGMKFIRTVKIIELKIPIEESVDCEYCGGTGKAKL